VSETTNPAVAAVDAAPEGARLELRTESGEMLIENRRGLLQVTGVLERDKRDRPVRMTAAFNIEELDISPISLGIIKGPVF
jgi:hypothetical protein